MRKILISALFLGAVLSGTALSAQTETSGRTGVYRATHTKTTELKHTKLKVSFDYQKEQMSGEEWLTASPYFYPTDSLVLNAKAMLIHEVAMDRSGTKTPLKYDYKDDLLKINLGKTYNRNENYTVYIKYTARPNEVKQAGSAAIADAKGLYFINPQGKETGKPTQIWTQGETESSSAWFPTVDKPNQKTTQEIYMTVPDKYVTLSNGILIDSKKEASGLRTDHWVMDKPHAPYLFFMGVGDYAVVKDKWHSIPVDYYVEKEYEPYAKQIFGMTPEMMEFFSNRLGYDYPWAKYAQIVGRDYVSGAMENTTATLHGESAQQKPGDLIDENRWEDVIAHELFHHWFGDLVTTESWSNLTVNESFADYSEYLWNEYKYGKDQADFHLMQSRRNYQMDPSNFTKDLVRFDYHSREDVFDGVSYAKGGAILHMLRKYLGDDAFFSGINDYLKTNEYKTGEAHQLRLSLEKISGKDLNWFFNQWYFGSGNPKLTYSYTYEPVKKQVQLTIHQSQTPLFEFPLTIDVLDGGKMNRQKVWVEAKASNTLSLPAGANPALVNLNADGVLLADIAEGKNATQYLAQYQNSKEFLSRYKAVEFAAEKASDDSAAKILMAAVKDPFFRIRMKALEGIDLTKPAYKSLASEVEKMAQNDPKTLVQGAAIAALGKTKDRKYLPVFEKALGAVSNSVKGNALAAISAIDPARVTALADKIDLEGAGDELIATLLPTIVKNKIEKHMPAVATTAAFYPFLKFQDAQLGAAAEDAFNWIMSSDNLKATENMMRILGQAKGQVAQNPQAKMMIAQMLKDGLAKKMQVLRANPQSPTINAQVDAINKMIESYK